MTDADILKILQSDLNFLVVDEPLKAQLTHYIDTAKALIQREGVTLVAPFSVEDGELIEMYVVFACLTVLAFWKHRENIKRLIHGNERKTYLFHKNKVDVDEKKA